MDIYWQKMQRRNYVLVSVAARNESRKIRRVDIIPVNESC